MPRDDASILDIHQAAQSITEFKEEMSKRGFFEDKKTQSAIVHQLLLIGEATKRLSETFRREHDHIPWRAMAGMRDRLIHDYSNVDLEEVWRTATRDIPQLLENLTPLLPEEE